MGIAYVFKLVKRCLGVGLGSLFTVYRVVLTEGGEGGGGPHDLTGQHGQGDEDGHEAPHAPLDRVQHRHTPQLVTDLLREEQAACTWKTTIRHYRNEHVQPTNSLRENR